jgi:hypothetical protein
MAQRPEQRKITIRSKLEGAKKRPAGKKSCVDCKAFHAFQYWREQTLTPSFNWEIDFSRLVNIPAGKRAVLELITATIEVPGSESARLRLFTSLGTAPSNLDLTMERQSAAGATTAQFMATHALRVYSDQLVSFNVNRDNAVTTGSAIICISGYMADS